MVEKAGNLAFLPLGDGAADPDNFLNEVLNAWSRLQRSNDFGDGTIRSRRSVVMKFVDFSGHFPWQWTLGDADEFFSHARGVKNLSHSTVRTYQGAIKLFCDFACNPQYDWNENCARLFGSVFAQVITELNRIPHSQPHEARSAKRPFSRPELQQLFDLADLEVDRVLNAGRKGALAALRDAVAFKSFYSWGLRANELRHLQVVDLSRNHRAPYFGDYGIVRVRWGKPHRGSAKKQRSVLTVWDWSAEMMKDWVTNGLVHYGRPVSDLFPTTAGSLVTETHLLQRLHELLDELGFPPGLDLHSFRRSYATHLIEGEGYDVTFVQMQLGHEHASTTSIYTLTSPDYQSRALEAAHNKTLLAAQALHREKKAP